ncbi:hypothetical protein [Streptomyces sp. NPDC058295]|uniref:hypothetical protein n=1 Tax=Streptomyces sp. NPDC058295 TaxID=3346431 RepID=UPI0036E93E18
MRRILLETGAVNAVEATITERHQQVLQALDAAPIMPLARTALRHLANAALWRSS